VLHKVSPSTIKTILILVGLVVIDGFVANLAWGMVGSRRSVVRNFGRVAAGTFAMANVALALYALLRWWAEGWDWFLAALVVVGAVFAFRCGGAVKGHGAP
jgi:uncharacterized membrane protein YfcA